MARDLTTDDVMGLLAYEGHETTEELYGLGSMLLAECIDRAKQLDARAMALTGYSGVTAALLISTFAPRLAALSTMAAACIIAAGLSLFAATVFAFSSLWIREYEWFSDRDWFAAGLLGQADRLKRSHLLAMHQYRSSHESVNARKASILIRAYCSLLSCGALLALGLILIRLT